MNEPKERILFLYLATGGGHIGPARALIAEIQARYAHTGVELHLLDGLPPGISLQRLIVEKGYTFSSTVAPPLWTGIFQISRLPFLMKLQLFMTSRYVSRHLADYITKHSITKVVSLHFLLNHALERALVKAHKPGMPRVTIVTDPFSVHPIWSYRNRMPTIVFSETAREQVCTRLRRQNLNPSRVLLKGPIVNSRFDTPLSPDRIRELKIQFGFDPDLPLVLLAGGGEGLPEGEKYLRALCQSGLPIQIAMVCGRNKTQLHTAALLCKVIADLQGDDAALATLLSLPKSRINILPHPRIPVRLYAFVPFMYELMNMADVILTKAGAGTVFEILSLNKPMIITRYLYGQETGNVEYVVRNGYGWFAPSEKEMLQHVQTLLNQPELQASIADRIKHRQPVNGTVAIARYIMEEL